MPRAKSIAHQQFEPELDIVPVLFKALSAKRAIDVGANHGMFTAAMRTAGFEVDSFEPLPNLAEELRQRFAGDPMVRVHQLACSNVNSTAELFAIAEERPEVDTSLFSTLQKHPTFSDLQFDQILQVETRRLDSLMQNVGPIGVLKVDTEGHDLAVIEGMGSLRPQAVLLEVWDSEFIFNQGQTQNRLIDYVNGMDNDYYKFSALFWRDSYGSDFGITLNTVETRPGSWGNVLFMHDEAAFLEVHGFLAARYRKVSDAGNFF